MRLAIVESPYAGKGATERIREIETQRNVAYARMCMRDSLMRGEAPFASHLLYTQPGILDDLDPKERKQGMEAGYEWMRAMIGAAPHMVAPVVAFYTDLGWSSGMKEGLVRCEGFEHDSEERRIGAAWHDSRIAYFFDLKLHEETDRTKG